LETRQSILPQQMATEPLPRLTFVLGGARSGKSSFAEALICRATPPWLYVATAEARDEEMAERIERHKRERGSEWRTLEVPLDLADALNGAGACPVLVDCLTLWLSNVLLANRNLDEECDRLIATLTAVPGPLVVVSNEVGLGIVPETALGRAFRDAQGKLNQRVAALADRVVLLVAGLPLTLK
jgi:adenosylcobinamide kinase/adenosylcobinamide-phosphate guanylyltransferase